MKKFLSLLLALATVLSMTVLAAASVSAADGTPKADNAVFVADSGDNNAAGTTPDAPVATLANAFSKLPNGGVVVIIGCVTIDKTEDHPRVMPEHSGVITLTSYYDGVDYRAKPYGSEPVTPRLSLCNQTLDLEFHGDIEMDWLRINVGVNPDAGTIMTNAIITMNYHNLTVGEHIENCYEDPNGVASDFDLDYSSNGNKANNGRFCPPILFLGSSANTSDVPRDAGGETITGEYTMNIAGGAWQSVRIGDRDLENLNTLDCHVTLNITGGAFTYWTGMYKSNNLSVMCAAQAGTTPNFVCDLTITGGTFYGEVCGFGRASTNSLGDGIQQGTVNMNILGGKWIRDYEMHGGYAFAASTTLLFDGAKVNMKVDPSKMDLGTMDQFTVAGLDGVTTTLEMVTESDKIGFFGLDLYFDETYLPLTTGGEVEETKPAETQPAETKPAETKPAETKPAETKPADTSKPASTEATGTKPASEPTDNKGVPAYVWAIVAVVVVAVVAAVIVAVSKKKKA